MSRGGLVGSTARPLDVKLRSSIEAHLAQYRHEVQPGTRASGLSRLKIYDFIVARDRSLLRRKKASVERTIDSVCREVAERELDQDLAHVTLIDSSDDEMSQPALGQAPGDSSASLQNVNRRLTAEWSSAAARASTSQSADFDEPTAMPPGGSAEIASWKRKATEHTNAKQKRVKSSASYLSSPTVTLAALGGVADCMEQILETVALPLTHPELYTHTGIQPPRGVLLHGPPGCGKTMLANAIAGELGLPFISLSAPAIVSGMSGESEKKLREVFEEARSLAPCVMFFDEIDAITPKRESVQREMERRIVAQMLTCMDDLALDKTDGRVVIVIGATNRPDALDPALRRAGRFDREICLAVPTEAARLDILRTITRGLRLDDGVDLAHLANRTPGYVGADLKALLTAAGVATIRRVFASLADRPSQTGKSSTTVETMDVERKSEGRTVEHQADLQRFLSNHQQVLTTDELDRITISWSDFEAALRLVQPSSKREGFTTVPDVNWTDIGALASIRAELQMAIVQPIRRPDLYSRVGIVAPAGVLLWGPPGCGKTLLAKAVANESRANFVSIRGPELLNKYVGESERAVRQVFSRARASAPCVIFFDELDALVPKRDDALSDSSARLVNTLLTELDGLGDRTGVYVIGATNRPDIIDPAMLRPGRLDKPLFVRLPVAEERSEILRTLARTTPVDAAVDLDRIANDARCHNFSGADLAALLREAAVTALRRTVFNEAMDVREDQPADICVSQDDFDAALHAVKPSVSDQERRKYENLRRSYP